MRLENAFSALFFLITQYFKLSARAFGLRLRLCFTFITLALLTTHGELEITEDTD